MQGKGGKNTKLGANYILFNLRVAVTRNTSQVSAIHYILYLLRHKNENDMT